VHERRVHDVGAVAVAGHPAVDHLLSSAGADVMLFGLGGLVFAQLSGSFVARLGETGLARWCGVAWEPRGW